MGTVTDRSASSWPLVGRDREVSALVSTLRRGTRGSLICGEAGVGKTRLLREISARWEADGGCGEWVGATATARGMAFGAMAHLVPSGAGASNLHELLHEALVDLEERAEVSRLALFVDDAHLLDDSSGALVQLVAARARVPLAVGIRSDEPTPEAVAALSNDDLLAQLHLAPLDEATTSALLDVVAHDLSVESRSRLWGLSRGNPLFLHELVALATDSGLSGKLDDPQALTLKPGSAARLSELLEARMGVLAPEPFDALELVALGEPLPAGLLRRLTDPESLGALRRRRLITVSGEDLVSTAHPLYGEAVRMSVGVLRQRSLLRRLADAVTPVDGVERIRVAAWRLEAGDRDPRLFSAAARDALGRMDYLLAERLLVEAMRDATPQDSIEPGLVLGQALMGQGRHAEAHQVLRGLAPTDDRGRARVATIEAVNLFRGLGREEEALAVLVEAEGQLSDPQWRAEVRSVRSVLMLVSMRAEEAVALAAPLVDQDEARDPARLRAVVTVSSVWLHRDGTERVLELTGQWIERTRAWRHAAPLVEAQLGLLRFFALLYAGRIADARRYAADGFGLAHPRPPSALRAVLSLARGAAAVHEGRGKEAIDHLRAAADGLPSSDWFYQQEFVRRLFLAQASLLAGDIVTARELCRAKEQTGAGDQLVVWEERLVEAWLDAAEGRVSRAVSGLLQGGVAAQAFSDALALRAFHDAARLGHAEEALPCLEQVVGRLGNRFSGACLAHARAIVGDDADALAGSARLFAELGALLLSAEADARAAAAYRARGMHGVSMGARERSSQVLEQLGHPYSPVFDLLPGDEVDRLTRREREIALMTVSGLSNIELARSLELSLHTVHTHLTRIYRKLGVTGRDELAARLDLDRAGGGGGRGLVDAGS
ncbi:MAG: LuxR C-terminal-related transcriptional regulator [Acidimicrobiales bacterium]